MRVLITRDEDGAKPYADFVRELGAEAVLFPLFDIRQTEHAVPDLTIMQGLVFTSAHAVHAFCRQVQGRHWPVYCVGPQTQAAAHQYGFEQIMPVPGTAGELAHSLKGKARGTLFYGRGKDIAFPLRETLAEANIPMVESILYEAVPRDAAPDFQPVDLALFFSDRAAQAFAGILHEKAAEMVIKRTKALSLGGGMVESLSILPWQSIEVAQSPDRAGMMALIEKNIVGYM